MSTIHVAPTHIKRKHKPALTNFSYELYECVQLIGVKDKNSQEKFQENVDIRLSSFYEGNGSSLLVLVCSNNRLLLILRQSIKNFQRVKQLNWFENPEKTINALCIDPIRGAWVLCVCKDSSVYLIPALAHMEHSDCKINPSTSTITASTVDLSRVHYARQLKGTPTCLVWWHTIDDQNIGIVGTKGGEIVFLDLAQRQEICRSVLNEKIVSMELLQDIHERTTHLFIQIEKKWTLELLLEQPSQSINLSSSLTQGYDMGFDMLSDCNVESILTIDRKEDLNLQSRIEVLPQDFQYSIHHIRDNIWIAKHDAKLSALEVFSDIKRVPEFIYHVPQNTTNVAICANVIFSVFKSANEKKISMTLLSRHLSTTAFGRQLLKKPELTNRPDLQTFQLQCADTIVACYKSSFTYPSSWQQLFPHNRDYEDECDLNSFIIVSNDGVCECRPRVSPEHYYTELVVKDMDVADRLGITFELNMPLLCEYIGDQIMESKDISKAMKFYNSSKCPPLKRAVKIVEHGTVTDALIYIKQVLKKPTFILSSKDKKRLADMAIACYIEQILEAQHSGAFSKNLTDSFCAFLCDNFDYDEDKAMALLTTYGMTKNLFEVGKARGKIDEALTMLAQSGCFLLTSSIQNMLLDCGYADKVCKSCKGLFIKHMQAEEQVRFLLAQPEVTREFLNKVVSLLPQLSEAPLLLIARVLDPSRQFIKPFLEKSDFFRRKRTGSSLSLASSNSTIIPEDPTVPIASEIILIFLKTLIELNSRRKWSAIPNMRLISKHLSGQLSWTGSLHKHSDSLGSNEMVKSDVARLRVACGRHHTAFVSAEKDLYTWGKASCGRLGHGDLMDENAASQPMRVESLHMHGIQVLSVSCGALHTVALCQEGVFSWGSNKYGQLGVGDRRKRSRPVLLSEISSKYINSVVCGHYHTLAITIDYNLYSWGWGIYGQLGVKSIENQVYPQHVSLLSEHRIIQAAAGYAHSAVLTSKGIVYTFGAGLYGQLGTGTSRKHTVPQQVETLLDDSIYTIACGSFETLAVSEEQTIFCWGRNYHQFHICGKADSARYGRQMASNAVDINHRYYPEDLPFKLQQPITQLMCGNWHYMALTSMNCVYTWGYNDCGQLGHYNKIDQPAPRLVKALSRKCVMGIAAGSEFSVVMDGEEQVLAWGRADGGLIGIENEGHVSTNPVARRSTFSVLAPTIVPGLPIHFDRVSIGSGHSGGGHEYLFDQHFDLPDLSAAGAGQPPYSVEAVLLSLYKLDGLYNANVVSEYANYSKQWFVLSYCCELKEEWDLAFTYRMKAIVDSVTSQDKDLPKHEYCEKTLMVVADLFKKLEDFLPEDVQENTNLVSMVKCVLKIFDYWHAEEFPFDGLEELLRKHVESLCPLYTVVFYGHLVDVNKCRNDVIRFSLYYVIEQHAACKQFTKFFFDDLLSNVIIQLDSGTNWYAFLSCSDDSLTAIPDGTTLVASVGETALSRDDMIREIVEHKRKLFNMKPFLTLSNAVATTLADASIAQKVSSGFQQQMDATRDSMNQPDSTVFSCHHNLPRYYMLETVIPEFISRMAELPEPLNQTAKLMARYYRQSDIKIPMGCPYCVYNCLWMEQLNVLRETGCDLLNIKSTVWEI